MANNTTGMNAQNLYAMGAQQTNAPQQAASASAEAWKCSCGTENTGKFCRNCGKAKPSATVSWTCKCGRVNIGKFCSECGAPMPSGTDIGWKCSCGKVNKGKFCSECGLPKPEDSPKYRCDKCGWEPSDPSKPPKFCPECGDIFNDDDKK